MNYWQGYQDKTGLSPADINDAVEIAENRGYVQVIRFLGTAPFNFGQVTITAEGRLYLESK